MIGLDTNVLVRYITQDEARQSARATKLIEGLTAESPGFVSVVVVIELFWVLTSCYDFNREQMAQVFEVLLRSRQLAVDRADQVARALRAYSDSNADFADCLIERTSASAGCGRTMTFDAGAAKAAGMTLIQ